MPETKSIMPETKSGNEAEKTGMDQWVHSQYALLGWTINVAKTMQALTNARQRANFDAWASLMSCKDPADLVRLQREYLENATAQYGDYAQDISRQMQQCADELTRNSISVGKS
jgi:hypothetical protein